jgi:hypothetical protein
MPISLQYYSDMAEIQKDYAWRLSSLTARNAKFGQTDKGDKGESASNEPSEQAEEGTAQQFESGDTNLSVLEFYTQMNGMNNSISSGLKETAEMITGGIFQVIDSNIKDMKLLLQEVKTDLANIDNHKSKEEQIQKSLAKLDTTFYSVSKADEQEVVRLDKVIYGEIPDDPTFIKSLSTAAAAAEGGTAEPDVYRYHYTGAGKDGEDMWTAHYTYRQAVAGCWEGFDRFEKAVNKAALLKLQCNQATCIVLSSTRRMFMREQGGMWTDMFPTKPASADADADADVSDAGAGAKGAGEAAKAEAGLEGDAAPSAAPAPASDAGAGAGVGAEREVPFLPPCTSVLKEGVMRFCSGEDTRKAIVGMTTHLGGASKDGHAVTGIPWLSVWGVLSSDGVLHLLSNEASEGSESHSDNKDNKDTTTTTTTTSSSSSSGGSSRVLLKSIPVTGSEIVIHSSDWGLFPLMMEIVPRSGSLMDAVMQAGSQKKDTYVLGRNDPETENWFTAIMHPVIGAVYARGGGVGPAAAGGAGGGKKRSSSSAMSPHRKNSLTPGSSVAMAAAASAAAESPGGATAEFSKKMEFADVDSALSDSMGNQGDVAGGEVEAQAQTGAAKPTSKPTSKLASPAGSTSGGAGASPKAETALSRSDTALQEAARLAEEWRFSDADGMEDDLPEGAEQPEGV